MKESVSHSVVSNSLWPHGLAHQAPLSMEFSRQEHGSGLPFPSPGSLPDQGLNLGLLHCRQILYHLSQQGSSWKAIYICMCQFSSVVQSCLTLCNPMDCSTPGLPVHHQLLELAQTHVYWVSDATQPSHPLSSPSPPILNLSQHQGLFKWVSSSHQVSKVLAFHLQHQSFQWIFRTDLYQTKDLNQEDIFEIRNKKTKQHNF